MRRTRPGYIQGHPIRPRRQISWRAATPQEDIIREFNDLFAVLQLMQANGVLPLFDILQTDLLEAKKEKISRMMLYSAERGRVTGDRDPSVPSVPSVP